MTEKVLKDIVTRVEQLEEVLKYPHCEEIDRILEDFRRAGFNKAETLLFIAQVNYLLEKDVHIMRV